MRRNLVYFVFIAGCSTLFSMNILTLGIWFENAPWRNWYLLVAVFLDCVGIILYELISVAEVGGTSKDKIGGTHET